MELIEVTNEPYQNYPPIQNTVNQEIDVSTIGGSEQTIDVTNDSSYNNYIEIQASYCQSIEVSAPCPLQHQLQVEIASKVPKALSILPQATSEQLKDRGTGRIYIDINGTPSFATLEQIKELNTRTICVDELSDNRINTLSDEDFILLRKD